MSDGSPPAGARAAFYALRLSSQFGQSLAYAVFFYLGGSSGETALGLSSVLLGMMAGAVLLGVPGGAVADSLGPPRALVLGATLRGAAITLPLFLPHTALGILAAAFAYSAVSQIFSPAELAMLRVLRAHPARGHAALLALQFAAHGGGLVLASGLILSRGVGAAILAGCAVYGVAVLLAVVLRRSAPGCGERAPRISLRPLVAAFRTRPAAAEATALLVYNDLATKCLAVTAPVYVFEALGLRGAALATLGAPAALGVLGGSVWAIRSGGSERALRGMRTLLLGTALALAALAGLSEDVPLPSIAGAPAPVPVLVLAGGASLLLGSAFGAFPIAGRAVLSAVLPLPVQARAFAAQASLSDLVVLLPLAGTGIGVTAMGPRVAFAGVAGAALLLFVLLEYGGPLLRWLRPVLAARRRSAAVRT